jgi:hypothetical protein
MMARKKPTMAKIELPYVKAYRDRTGVWRYYFRRGRRVFGTIPGKSGSPEFMQAYQDFLGSPAPKEARHEHGTIGHLNHQLLCLPQLRELETCVEDALPQSRSRTVRGEARSPPGARYPPG